MSNQESSAKIGRKAKMQMKVIRANGEIEYVDTEVEVSESMYQKLKRKLKGE